MRGSAWIVPLLATALWIAAFAWPTAAAVQTVISQEPNGVAMGRTMSMLAVTSGWAASAAVGAMLLGWMPGRVLGSALARRGFGPLAVLMLVPICLPAYVVFFAWWQAWPAGSWLYTWAVEQGHVQLVRQGTLLTGFLCWSWPIVALCVAGSVAATPAQRGEMLRLDGARWWQRAADRFRCDARGLAIGGLVVFLATFNNTTSFDLAEIFTFGNELRAIEALGGNNRDVLAAATPATLLTVAGAGLIWLLLGRGVRETAIRAARVRLPAVVMTAALWIVSVALPLALLGRNVLGAGGQTFGEQLRQFRLFYTEGLVNTIGIAAATATLAVIAAIGLAWMWQDRRGWVRALAHVQAVGWIVAAAVPGTMLGVAMRSAYNRPVLDELIYTQPAVLVLGHLAAFSFLGALMGRWAAAREPQPLADLRALDGAERFGGLIAATWPQLVAAGAATFALVFVLSMSEIPVTATVRPAGFDAITTSVLNDMHYQRPQTVMIAAGIFLLLAILASGVVALAWNVVRRLGRSSMAANAGLLLACTIVMVGCGGSLDAKNTPPLKTEFIFGSGGRALGQFNYPRAVAMDKANGYLYVVDVTARIQRYGLDGKPQLFWEMPEFDTGKPTGLTVHDNGTLYVADTHYFRVVAFDSDGNELMRFGEYGVGPGQFIYTTGVAFGPDDRIYVSEAGGNDRVQVFDAQGQYLFQFGSFGSEPGQFNRPQSLAFNAERTELYIADACNHRIVVTDPEGNLLRILGEAGAEPGQFSYPYDVMVLPDGDLLICEYHNCRLQRISPTGEPRGLYGRVGRGEGELQYPWGVDGDAERLYVLDSGNNRVQVMATP